jgi:hypothetical protein
MHGCNVGEALEVGRIQREDTCKALRLHERSKPSIVYLHTTHVVSNNQLTPNRIDLIGVRQQHHCAFDLFDSLDDLRLQKAISISLNRAGAYVSILRYILGRKVELLALMIKGSQSRLDELML